MKLRSFRLRMAILSVVTSGIILVALVAISISTISRIGMERIDRELLALGDTQARGPRPHWHWSRFEESLASLYGADTSNPLSVRAYSRAGHSIYISPRWPAEISSATLGIHEVDGPSEEPDLALPWFEPPRPGSEPPPPPPMLRAQPRWLTVASQARTWRCLVMEGELGSLALAMDLTAFHAEIRRFRNRILLSAPVFLLLLAAAGGLLAGQAIRPVKTIASVAEGITAKGLSRRVPSSDADYEFQFLIDVINGMLDRLERSFQQATRFSADAAHELKTPLTVLQGQLQQALRDAQPNSPEQRKFADLIEEVQILKVIVRKLLLLAQADSGQMRVSLKRVNLSAEIEALAGDVEQAATGLSTERTVDPEVFVMADPDLLRQALQNLASNAIKHNRASGAVAIRLAREGANAVFTLSNTINPNIRIDSERLFERFYRGDTARSRTVDGVGLGLSLAREIVRAHRGDLVLGTLREDTAAFVLTLPVVA